MFRISCTLTRHFKFHKLTMTPAPTFSASNKQNQSKQQTLKQTRQQRQKDIQYRTRIKQNAEIKAINDRIDTTKGYFSPIMAYFNLYRGLAKYILLLAGTAYLMNIIRKITGTYEDPFSKSKKIILISDSYEQSVDYQLKSIVIAQISGNSLSANAVSPTLNNKGEQLQKYLKSIVGKQYKIVIVASDEQIITVLPKTIVISKRLLLSNRITTTDIQNCIVLMQSLFAKKYHIKQLTLIYLFLFYGIKIRDDPLLDVKLTHIYSRQYSQLEVSSIITQIQRKYAIPAENIIHSLQKMLNWEKKQNSLFAMGNRFKQVKF